MFKLITIVAVMIAAAAAAPGLASLGHGPILGGYGSPLALSAPISYGAPIAKIATPIAAPAYGLGGHLGGLGGHLGLGSPLIGSPLIGSPIGKLGVSPLALGGHGLGLGYGLGAHGLGAPIW